LRSWVSIEMRVRWALAVKLQPVDDLVNHLALGAHREANQIELGAGKPEVGFVLLAIPSRISPANSEGLLS